MSSKGKFAVYRNLNNGFLSIQDVKSGLVIGHCDNIKMTKVSFKVSNKGVEKIRRRGVKSVVAKVVGQIAKINNFVAYKGRSHGPYLVDDFKAGKKQVFFDPYKWGGFVDKNNQILEKCNNILIRKDGQMFMA